MTRQELKQAQRLLRDRVDRTDSMGLDGGGYTLTAYWLDGGQRLFYTLDSVTDHLESVELATSCESCRSNPATTRSDNPDWNGYRLCGECAAEYDKRQPVA